MKLFSIPQHGRLDLTFHGRELARVSEPPLVHEVWWELRLLETATGKLVLAASMHVPDQASHADSSPMVISSALVFQNIHVFEEYLRMESVSMSAMGCQLLEQANKTLGRLFVPSYTDTGEERYDPTADTDYSHF